MFSKLILLLDTPTTVTNSFFIGVSAEKVLVSGELQTNLCFQLVPSHGLMVLQLNPHLSVCKTTTISDQYL